jgi:hypothetical protein
MATDPRLTTCGHWAQLKKYKESAYISSVANSFNQTNLDICPTWFTLINRQVGGSAVPLILLHRPEFNARLFRAVSLVDYVELGQALLQVLRRMFDIQFTIHH